MPKYVRVKDKQTRHEFTVTESAYQVDKDHLEVVKKDATRSDGVPLPPKFHQNLSRSTTGQKADPEKEND